MSRTRLCFQPNSIMVLFPLRIYVALYHRHMAIKNTYTVLGWSRRVGIITRRRSWSLAQYCKHFVARLNDVHAFGYNSAGSELIWMKCGELQACFLELSLANFGREPRRSGSGSASRNFVFCTLNNSRFHRLPVGQISRNLHKKTCFRVRMCRVGKHLWKFARKGSFFPKKLHFDLIEVNDFRLPESISPKRLQILESHDRLARLRNVGFPLTPLEWTQSDSPGL